VVALAMDIGASAVRGNHEDNVLRAHKILEKKKHRKAREILETVPDKGNDGSTFKSQEDLTETRKRHDDEARSVAKSLSKKQIHWLSSLPLMLRIDHLHGATHPPWNAKEIIVVHAGLVPAVPLHKQDPWAIMNMRTLLYRLRAKADDVPETADAAPPSADIERHIEAIPSDARQGEPWSHSWNRFQNLSFPLHSDRTLVIYGHDARAGLQANPKVVIRPHPAARRGRYPNAAAAQKRNDVNGIEVNIGPEIEVENDGDVAIDVDSGVTINATTTTTTSDSEAEAKKKKRTGIEINVDPTEVLDADGDIEAEVEGEFEIEIENDDEKKRKVKRDDDDTIELSVTPVIAVEADGDVDVGVEVDMEVAVANGSVHITNGTMCKRDGEGVIVAPDEGEVDDENDDDDGDDDDETGSDNDFEAERRKKKKGKKGGRKRKGVRYAFGIDSGCGHGRKLTALVLEATEPDGVVLHRLEQVDCGAEGRG